MHMTNKRDAIWNVRRRLTVRPLVDPDRARRVRGSTRLWTMSLSRRTCGRRRPWPPHALGLLSRRNGGKHWGDGYGGQRLLCCCLLLLLVLSKLTLAYLLHGFCLNKDKHD